MRSVDSRKNKFLTFSEVLFLLVSISVIWLITRYVYNLAQIRNRDAIRIAALSDIQSALVQKINLDGKIPTGDYEKLKAPLGFFVSELPQDPLNNSEYKYYYKSNSNSFVLYCKMESKNGYASADKGKFNKKPLYYELGYGKDWQNLVPSNLK